MASQETYSNPNSLPYNNPKQTRMVALVTGGNSGLGYYTCLHLYMHGWTVYIASRNPTKASQAARDIKLEAESRIPQLPQDTQFGEILTTTVDFGTLEGTKKGVLEFIAKESQLDLLINNAGVMGVPTEITPDGLDIQIQANHVAPFYFTINLIPLLEQSKYRRIVFLSSMGHAGNDGSNDMSRVYPYIPNLVSGMLRYANSKLANIQTAKALCKRFPSFTVLAVHPGICLQTNLSGYFFNFPVVGGLFKIVGNVINHYAGLSNEEGSYNTLYASLSPELTAEKDNGKYYIPFGKEATPAKLGTDPVAIEKTWEWTLTQLIDRKYFTPEEAQLIKEPLNKESLSIYQDASASAPQS